MKVLIAPDSFKGSLSAMEAAEAMAEAIKELDSTIETVLLPAADGGEGTMSSVVAATGGTLVAHEVEDPLGRKVAAHYGVLGDGRTCIIEIAEASGLTLLKEQELDPLTASSFGTGELLRHALDAGFRTFIVGLGGSATNDGGAGMLEALGMKFLDQQRQPLKRGGGALGELVEIDASGFDARIEESVFLIACDVENPLIGESGASAVFGPQKGATPEMVRQLDANLQTFADITERLTGMPLQQKRGAGAAGGAGGAMQAFFAGEMKRGIDVVLDAISFHDQLETIDLIVTGEGKTDSQTLSGKTPLGIAEAGKRAGKPVLLISGMIDNNCSPLLEPYFTEIHSVVSEDVTAEQSINDAFCQLKNRTHKIIKAYLKK